MYSSDLGILNSLITAYDFITNLSKIYIFNSVLSIVIMVCILGVFYAAFAYITMCQGRKAGLSDDWFAFVPVAASIYRLDMVGESRWKVVFVGGLSKIILLLLCILFYFMGSLNVIVAVLFELIVLGFWAMRIALTYSYKRKLYRLFNFNENFSMFDLLGMLSWMALIMSILLFANNSTGSAVGALISFIAVLVISATGIFSTIFNFMSAFDNRCVAGSGGIIPTSTPTPATPVANSGKMVCTAGMYNGAEFQVESEFEIIIGRDSFFSSIIISEGAKSVSRKHCGVRYDKSRKEYLVTDYSSNGTYIAETGERLQRNIPCPVQRGSSIYLGDKSNRFKLM